MHKLKRLFEPIKIGQMELRNRLKLPAVALSYAHDMRVTDRLKNFYVERAKGGVALIGITCTATRLDLVDILVGIYDDRFIPGLRELVDSCHKYGAKIYAQVGAGYGWAFGDGPVEIFSPSGITASGRAGPPLNIGTMPGAPIRALTIDEIHQIVDAYGEAARRARQAGFDAFEFLASTGYMLNQFLSPLSNKRTDEYGGSLENRTRVFTEVIRSIKSKAGKDYPLLCRISTTDMLDGGYTVEDGKQIARILEAAGVDCFDAMPGWHEAIVPMIQPSVPQGHWLYIAEELKKVVNVPVATGTQISDLALAEQALVDGKADLICMARSLIADPELPNKAKEGRIDDIRPCIHCCHCFDLLETPVACTVNARAGKEGNYVIQPAAQSKRVFVIGGGPGGMEAAITAAKRGHKVTILEKEKELGGQMLIAALPPHKGDIDKLTRYLRNQMRKAGVNTKIGQKADLNSISADKPDQVIIAAGATPIIPNIPGVKGRNVVIASEVLTESKPVGDKVIIIGGGMVGCEIAEFLAQKNKQVTILEILKRIGSDIGRTTRWVILDNLRQSGIRMETGVETTEITEKGVRGLKDGSSVFFEADTVVLAVGAKANTEFAKQSETKVPLHFIGDCVEPRRIVNAIEEGFKTACQI